MTLKNTYLEPRYVLLLPETREGHERRLREKGVYTDEQVQLTVRRAEFYAQFNAEHPGFFDTTVTSGSIRRNRFFAGTGDYACNYAFLRSVVCLSVVCRIRAPCLKRSTDLDAIWQVHLWGPATRCVG